MTSTKLRPRRDAEAEIVYKDSVLVVVNKPSGLLTVPLARRHEAPSVESHLALFLRSHGKRKPLVVHRLDRDTSGLVVFALNGQAQRLLKDQFSRREPERVYLAVVHGHPSPASGRWRDQLVWDERLLIQRAANSRDSRAAEAESEYRVLEIFADASLLEIRLITGKRNQIRVQARLRGHTLVGEQQYVDSVASQRIISFPRQALHAARLAFRHPSTGQWLRFEAPLPPDLSQLLAKLRRS